MTGGSEAVLDIETDDGTVREAEKETAVENRDSETKGVSDGQLTEQRMVLLLDGSCTRIWRWSLRGCCGKSVDTFCVAVNLFANVATLSPLNPIRSARVLSGPTGSGSVSLGDRVSCDGNADPINTTHLQNDEGARSMSAEMFTLACRRSSPAKALG